MKVWIELDGETELNDFLRWRRLEAARLDARMKREEIDVKYGRTEIACLGWPDAIVQIARAAGVETVQQAYLKSDNEWLKTPRCGRKHLITLRDLLAEHERSNAVVNG